MRNPFLEVLCLLGLLGPWAWAVQRFWFLCDDAFISFRYSVNWATGAGLRYNLGEHTPIEGYSNFLWVALCALGKRMGIEPTVLAPWLSAVCGGLLIVAVFLTLRRLRVSLLAAFVAVAGMAWLPPFAVWSSSGLETMMFCLLLFATFERLVLAPRVSVWQVTLVGLLLALVRAEALAWFLCFWVMAGVVRPLRARAEQSEPRSHLRPWLVSLGAVVVLYAVYFALRYDHFGRPFANTVYAKVGASAEFLRRGFDYVTLYWLTFLTPFLLFLAAPVTLTRTLRWTAFPTLAVAFGIHLYGVLSGGDFMTMGRFLVPALSFQAVTLGATLHCVGQVHSSLRWTAPLVPAAVLVLGILPGFDRHVVPESVRAPFHVRFNSERFRSEYGQWAFMKRNTDSRTQLAHALKEFADGDASLVCTAVGVLGYETQFTIFDRAGLVTPAVEEEDSRRKRLGSPGHDKSVKPEYFLDREPTFLRARMMSSFDPEAQVRRAAKDWREGETGRQYVADYRIVDEGDENTKTRVLFVVRRLREEETSVRAWRRFDRRLREELRPLMR